MLVIHKIADLRRALVGKQDVALVPTMGNLHGGHLSLVKLARDSGGCVVTSIFVNPLQFAPHEDFAQYPRTLERDAALLASAGVDIVFAPTVEEMYPDMQGFVVEPPAELADILEGEIRPGFFIGVCTVVLKLFNMVQPTIAVFGRKDYQQQLIIKNMVRQLALPIKLRMGDIVRDTDGLALSSRNNYLSESERVQGVQLVECLREVGNFVRSGRSDWPVIEREACESLRQRGWQVDYISIRLCEDLSAPRHGDALLVLGAARIGVTRLIDNVEI